MAQAPIPQRIAPLSWRKPAFLWTPLGLALGIGWPLALFYDDVAPQRLALTGLFIVFAIALVSLGASWVLGRAPKARRVVVSHVVTAGLITALISPFVLTQLLENVASAENSGAHFTFDMAMAMMPLALVLGLPIALVSGVLFAWTALKPSATGASDLLDDGVFRGDVQPFR
ncbi:MAG: hypothetical protein J0L81_03785 [Caulobacterales bacterium]|jgi:hypothetical protein|nr:hypothetical protein [Caulobacterales bacterium]